MNRENAFIVIAYIYFAFISAYMLVGSYSVHNNKFKIIEIQLNSCLIKEIPTNLTSKIFWIPLKEEYSVGDTLTLGL